MAILLFAGWIAHLSDKKKIKHIWPTLGFRIRGDQIRRIIDLALFDSHEYVQVELSFEWGIILVHRLISKRGAERAPCNY